MHLAVCDDDPKALLCLSELLSRYEVAHPGRVSHAVFDSGDSLLHAMHAESFDLIFLDVLMPGLNGMQTAREIREGNDAVRVVFLTSTPEFAVESYQVKALNYLLKPATEEQLYPILDGLLQEETRPEPALCLRTTTRVFRLQYRRIEAVEVLAKKLYFYLTDGSREEISGSLHEYEETLLAQPGFYKVHRSYLVNLRWVRDIQKWELTTESGRHVPISRPAYAQVRKAYMDYLFADAQPFKTEEICHD